jgi:predicted nucleic acid-binding protein
MVKLILDEPESEALRRYVDGADLLSCELILVEVPRAVRRAAARDSGLPLDLLMSRAEQVVNSIALAPLDRGLLLAAGALAEPMLRALDAIHVAAALGLGPIDAFVSYDERQSAVARLAGMRTISPGT